MTGKDLIGMTYDEARQKMLERGQTTDQIKGTLGAIFYGEYKHLRTNGGGKNVDVTAAIKHLQRIGVVAKDAGIEEGSGDE